MEITLRNVNKISDKPLKKDKEVDTRLVPQQVAAKDVDNLGKS